ncbi:MAG: PASTA domain-containing protein [bacterium]|nr:PASTA domain-containing protein [bacterium]
MKTFGIVILIIVVSFALGVIGFNFIVMPLWVGLHEETTVPDVCGKTLEDAKNTLSKLELKSEVKAQKFSNMPEGVVISQIPLPTRRVRKGRIVELCISKGIEKVKVPWVQGLLVSQAQNLIERTGFKLGELNYEYSTTVPEGKVIYTIPSTDSLVPKGYKIDIFVSGVVKQSTMPELTGRSLKEVKEEVDKLGLDLVVKYAAEPSSLGIVILQSPPAGATVKAGDSLYLIVGRPSQK